jgi:hypothetical protein
MSRRPASITQADVRRIVRGAKQAGAAEVEVRLGESASVLIRMQSSTGQDPTPQPQGEIVL